MPVDSHAMVIDKPRKAGFDVKVIFVLSGLSARKNKQIVQNKSVN